MIKKANEITQLRAIVSDFKQQGYSVGFVPTMGNCHAGHAALIKAAKLSCDKVVVSVFVNPLQFAAHEDLDTYPRTLAADLALFEALAVDAVFTPSTDNLYPDGMTHHCQVRVPVTEGKCCAVSRPHFFSGVATVVMKLLQCVQPDTAFFGEKDYQQLRAIQTMVRDFCMPVEIIGVPLVRENDGLAMSSRNQYLSRAARQKAPQLYQTLMTMAERINNGARDYVQLQHQGASALEQAGFSVDYCTVCSQDDLSPANQDDTQLIICAAATLEKTRLIDNVRVTRGDALLPPRAP